MYSYTGNNPVNRTDPTGKSYFMGSGANDPFIREFQDGVYYPRGSLADEVGTGLAAHNQRLKNTMDVIAANRAAAKGDLEKFFDIVNSNNQIDWEYSGTVTVTAEVFAPDGVTILRPEGPFVASDANLENMRRRGDGDCAQMPQVDLEKQGIGLAENWLQGASVYRNYAKRRGTAIATFVNGRYPNKKTGNHVAYFLHHVEGGFRVLEQVRGAHTRARRHWCGGFGLFSRSPSIFCDHEMEGQSERDTAFDRSCYAADTITRVVGSRRF
jgi:hypothetical protein